MIYSVTVTVTNDEKYNYIVEAPTSTLAESVVRERFSNILNINTEAKNNADTEVFDYYLKQSFLAQNPYMPGQTMDRENCFGFYISRYHTVYDRYFSTDVKNKIRGLISLPIKEAYANGKGNEFSTGKFFSVASSSRFIVSSFSEYATDIHICEKIGDKAINNPKLEYGMPVDGLHGGTPPQLDMHFSCGDSEFFIEAKCHEILTNHKNINLSRSYMAKSTVLKKQILDPLGINYQDWELTTDNIDENITVNGRKLTAEDFGIQIQSYHFDFKQFLCHLMGILSSPEYKAGKHINFVYLFYKSDRPEFTSLYTELLNEIDAVAKKFKVVFGEQITFGVKFNNKFDTLKDLDLDRSY